MPIHPARYTVGMPIRHSQVNTAARRRAPLALIILLAGGLIGACATVKQTTDKIKAALPTSETAQAGRKTVAPAVEASPATLPGADPPEATAPAKPAAPIVPAETAVSPAPAGSIAPTPQAAPPLPRFGPRVPTEKTPESPPSIGAGASSTPDTAPAEAIVNGPAWLSKCHNVQVAGGVVQCDADTLLARPSPQVRVFTSDPAQADAEADITLREGLPRRYRFFVVP